MSKIGEVILEQLGGNKFVVMTGVNHLVSDKNSLTMFLPKNRSKANRLKITLNWDDTYTMRFFRYSSPRMNHKTMTYSSEKVTEIEKFDGIYFDQLPELFTQVKGLYTRLF